MIAQTQGQGQWKGALVNDNRSGQSAATLAMTTTSSAASGQKSACRHVRLKKTTSLSVSGQADV